MVRRLSGIAMLAVETALLQLTLGYKYVGVAITLIALAGCLPQLQFTWSLRRRALAMGAVAVFYYLLLRLEAFDLDPLRSEPLENASALAGALCFMSLQAIQFYWRNPRGLPLYYPLLGVMALAYAADQYLGSPEDARFAFTCAMFFGLLMTLFYATASDTQRAGQTRYLFHRLLGTGLCVLLSFGLAAGTAWGLKNSDRKIAQWMAERVHMDRIGLGNNFQSRLDSITNLKTRDGDRIALQIEAESAPGYLRGQAYLGYEENTWTAIPPGETAREATRSPGGYVPLWRDARLFEVQPKSGDPSATLTVFPGPEIDRALFAPLESGWLARRGGLQVNHAGIVQSPGPVNGQPYQVVKAAPTAVEPLNSKELENYLQLPEALAPRLKTLAEKICPGRSDPGAKASAIAEYFRGNYEYKLGIQVPRDQDPLEYFLFSDPHPAAHCEFFATGAALLLRASGVPARYVTGVGVWEQHPFAEYWVARNRDAHAWVEAWSEEEGWFIVEATPVSGLPEAGMNSATNALSDLWSLLSLHIRRLWAALREGAWHLAIDALAALLVGLYQLVQEAWLSLLSALVLVMFLLRFLHYRRNRPIRLLPQGELARRLHRQLGTMDRSVRRRHRLERAAHVTPHAFAHEIELTVADPVIGGPLARWYRRWAEVRYQLEADGGGVEGLEAELRTLKRRRHRRRG
jgi:transglutaminase-like putative cysteine protease